MNFTKVTINPALDVVARVNRLSGELQISPQIWQGLDPDQKEFILYHENGHLVLNTAEEFAANGYAIEQFLEVGILGADEFGRRILVISEIMDPENQGKFKGHPDHLTPGAEGLALDPISAVSQAVGNIFQNLPLLGIGSAARKNEMVAQADQQIKVLEAQAEAQQNKVSTYILIGAGLLCLILVSLFAYFAFKK